jgi:hypothetical protein
MSRRAPALTEAAMLAAERRFPELAAKAGRAAYRSALARTGAVVVMTHDDRLVERRTDGTFTVIKSLPSSKRVKLGVILKRVKQDMVARAPGSAATIPLALPNPAPPAPVPPAPRS